LGQATFLEPREFLRDSFLDGLATVGKDFFLNQSVKSIQGGFV
jgi:hypothetical protein